MSKRKLHLSRILTSVKGLKTSELVLGEGCLVCLFAYAMEMNRKWAGATSEISVFLFHCGKRCRMSVRELGDITLHQWPNQGGTSPSGSLFGNWHSTVTLEEKQNRTRSERNQKV